MKALPLLRTVLPFWEEQGAETVEEESVTTIVDLIENDTALEAAVDKTIDNIKNTEFAQNSKLDVLIDKLIELGTSAIGKIFFAILTLVIGCLIIKGVKKLIAKGDKYSKMDRNIQGVMKSLANIVMYGLLITIVISILGIPMTTVAAVVASCGLAIGLALQGALGNLAGGIMIMMFKPFLVGDFIAATGEEGYVKEIRLFYTTILTRDNKRVTIPNGDLMNSNVTDFTGEEKRRIDIDFKINNDCDQDYVSSVLSEACVKPAGVLTDPAPFVRLTAVDDDTWIFSVRVWCISTEYLPVRYDVLEACSKALTAHGIDDPEERVAIRIVKDEDGDDATAETATADTAAAEAVPDAPHDGAEDAAAAPDKGNAGVTAGEIAGEIAGVTARTED